MPPSKRKMHNYTEEAMQNALSEVQRGMRVATAAKLYQVPRVTLLYKAKGTTPPYRRMGPESILSPREENLLAEWIISVRKAGFHVNMNELFNSVQFMIIQNKRPNPFKNNRPGRTWFVGFKRRNPRILQYLSKSKHFVTKENISRWFDEAKFYLKEKIKGLEILEDPQRIFNGDEVALPLNPENPEESENLTIFLTGNAKGDFLPPLIVYKDQFPEGITNCLPENWGIGKTDSGWVNSEIFFNFISKVFKPFLDKENVRSPVILFVDAQKSYLTLQTSQFCEENGIVLMALYPKATHLLEPMEVEVFKFLEELWSKNLKRLCKGLHKLEFPNALSNVLGGIPPEILQRGFRKSGLFPWDSTVLNTEFTFSETTKSNKANVTKENVQELKAGLDFLEKYVEKEKIKEFKVSKVWRGDPHDLGLFNLWKKTEDTLRGLNFYGFDYAVGRGRGFESDEEEVVEVEG